MWAAILDRSGTRRGNVFKALAVNLLVRDVDDLGGRLREAFDQLSKALDGDFLIGADVEHFAHGVRAFHQLQHGADYVANPGKAAGLLAVAVNRDRLTASACDTRVGMTIP